MAANLLKDSDSWGRQAFRLVAYRDGRNWWASPRYKSIIAHLAAIPQWDEFVAAQQDIMPELDRLDLGDNNSVRALQVVHRERTQELVVKVLKESRVPSVFHEAHVAHLLRERSVTAPRVVGIVEGYALGTRSYMVMVREQRSVALSDMYRRLSARDLRNNPSAESKRLARAFGRAVSRLIHSGIVHEELDLKNVRVGTGRSPRFMFLDFERTRLFLDEPDEDVISTWLKDAISRRLSRHHFPQDFVDAFITGYLKGGRLTVRCIARLVERVRAVSGNKVAIVAIDGFAGSGKSTVAEELRAMLERCLVIETDLFMRYSRRDRAETSQRLNDHRGWYDISGLRDVILKIRGGALSLGVEGLYSHESGELDTALTLSILPGTAIIIEGMYAMSDELIGLCDLTILLDARRAILLQRVTHRDSIARKIQVSAIGARFCIINGPQYRRWFASRTHLAHLWLDTGPYGDAFKVLGGSARVLSYSLLI